MASTHRTRRSGLNRASRALVEPLELRRMLCGMHVQTEPIVELRPDLIGVEPSGPESGGPADIVWVNRGVTSGPNNDRFNDVFGAGANTARAVIDAVIVEYERMITSFNYADNSTNYNLTVKMGPYGGTGGRAGIPTTLGGKPKSGDFDLGVGPGWFIDPTPFEHEEFMGSIENAYAGDAQAGSPAAGRSDFYTVAAAELAHCLGLSGGVPLFDSRTTNTGIPDTAEGNGVGSFYTFDGPSIQHLMTSLNGGSDFGSATHGAGPGTISFNNISWTGAQDAMNAKYEHGRRYLVPDTLGLILKDSYNFTTVTSGRPNFYLNWNPDNRQLLLRGDPRTDNTFVIKRNGFNLEVSVDPLADVPGTGALPGAGNLPAFTELHNFFSVSSIVVQGSTGTDRLIVDESVAPGFVYTFANNFLDSGLPDITLSSIEPITILAGSGGDTFNVTTQALQVLSIDGGANTDIYNIINTSASGPAVILSGAGADILNVNLDNVGSARADVNNSVTLGAINLGNSGGINIFGTNTVLRTSSVTMGTQFSSINLTNNSMIIDYTGASPLPTIQGLLTSGYAGGNWNGFGIRTSDAFAGSTTSLGYAEATDLFSTFPATFAGQQVDNTSILIRYTLYGDANLDGAGNLSDFNRLAANFGQSDRRWSQGDFDFTQNVNLNDFNRLASNFGLAGSAPEWRGGFEQDLEDEKDLLGGVRID